jgi:hypothetical protein
MGAKAHPGVWSLPRGARERASQGGALTSSDRVQRDT